MSINKEQFPRQINVPGYVMRPAFLHIQDKFRGVDNLCGIEIGIYLGENAEYVLRNLKPYSYTMIDPYTVYGDRLRSQGDWDEIYNWISGLFKSNPNVCFIRTSSEKASEFFIDKKFDFIYIDGDHSFEAVEKDLDLWYNKVKSGGVLCGHDYNNLSDVKRAVDKFCNDRNLKLNVKKDWYTSVEDWWVDV